MQFYLKTDYNLIFVVYFDVFSFNLQDSLNLRNLKNTHLTPIFRLHNIHLVFSTCPHKYKWILCTENPVLKASFDNNVY